MTDMINELKNDKAKLAAFVLLLIFFTSIVTYQIALPAADDMARHLVNGREILQGNFSVLYKNVYSYTLPEAPFVNHHWLSGVIFYLLFVVIGWKGLVIFKILVLLATFTILFETALRRSDFWLVSMFSIPAIFLFTERSSLRPEIFSYLFIAIFLYVLIDLEKNPDSKKVFWLIPLQLLWVNMHLFFIVGPALVGGYLVEKMVEQRKNLWGNHLVRNLLIVLLLLFAVSLVNPNGLRGALYPIKIFQDYGFDVQENNPLSYFFKTFPFGSNIAMAIFIPSVVLLGLSFVINVKRKKRPIFLFLGSVATAAGGFVIARLLSAFGAFFLLAAPENFTGPWNKLKVFLERFGQDQEKIRKAAGILFILMLLLLIIVSRSFLVDKKLGLGLTVRAEDAGQFFKDNNLQGPIFNDYDSGSYLIYYLYPKEKVFVDNRPEAYSGEFWKSNYEPLIQDEAYWQENLPKYNFNVIFFYRYDAGPKIADFFYRRLIDPEWALVYVDNYAVIYLRNVPANKDIIEKWKITPENAQVRMSYLLESGDYEGMVGAADNFNLVGRTDLAREAFWRVVTRWPERGKVWKVMADWQLSDNSIESTLLSIMYLNRALEAGYRTTETYSLLAAAYIRVGYLEEARKEINHILSIDPEDKDALDLLEIIKSRSK